jgi:hypothetical protein
MRKIVGDQKMSWQQEEELAIRERVGNYKKSCPSKEELAVSKKESGARRRVSKKK